MARHSIGTKAFAPVNVPIDLSKGTTSVHFHIPEGCKRPSDINELGNPDSRCLSIAVQDLKVV